MPVPGIVRDMVHVPAASFMVGSPDWVVDWLQQEGQPFPREWFTDETPQCAVAVDAFWIDRNPVTNGQFLKFIDDTGFVTAAERRGYGMVYTDHYWEEVDGASWRTPGGPGTAIEDRLDHPVVLIAWTDATAYADWAGLRLPTEPEWELAARGADYRLWPWGDEWCIDNANSAEYHVGKAVGSLGAWRDWWASVHAVHGSLPQTTPVGAFPGGASPSGALDMAGNVYEWTSSLCALYGPAESYDPMFRRAEGVYRVLRGGSWMNFRYQLRCSDRMYGDPADWSNFALGFRCASSVALGEL